MSSIRQRTQLVGQLLQTQGPGWLAFRASHALRRRCGLLRRHLPLTSWEAQPLASFLTDAVLAQPETYLAHRRATPGLFVREAEPRNAEVLRRWDQDGRGPVALAGDLSRGLMRYFAHNRVPAGMPPRWHVNAISGQSAPADRHWTQIGDFDQGDIKVIWEPSRFAFAFDLARAYERTGDEAHAELFWTLFESWRAENPPQHGPNWKCGQEISLRVMAMCFALTAFLHSSATTPKRVTSLAQTIAVSGNRIEATLAYALSQHNNHGVSEGLGLWTVGALFPEFRASARWARKGRRVLEELGRTLVYEDGAFSQHSLNYHRVMLHAYVWALRLGDVVGSPFSPALRERVGLAAEFLYQLQDEQTGRVPCYGHNDGALILPLNNCDAQDYRPVIQAAHYLASGRRRFPEGPWDEDLYWLFGARALNAAVEPGVRADFSAPAGGYHTLLSETGFAFVRCARFRHRPGQADMLHADIWWRGHNVAIDAGTYSYNAPAPWNNALAQTAVHNTVAVDGRDQMERAGKFLWLPWLKAEEVLRKRSSESPLACWEGRHDGYHRLAAPVTHRRAIARLTEAHWLIVDQLESTSPHSYRLHWLLPDWPFQETAGEQNVENRDAGLRLAFDSPSGPYEVRAGSIGVRANRSLVRAEPDGVRGWRSPYYMHREPALSLALTVEAAFMRFWTLFGPPVSRLTFKDERLEVAGPSWSVTAFLSGHAKDHRGPVSAGFEPIVTRLACSGGLVDSLEIS